MNSTTKAHVTMTVLLLIPGIGVTIYLWRLPTRPAGDADRPDPPPDQISRE